MVVVVIVIVVFGFELVDDGWCLMRKHQMVDRCVFTTESILMIQQSNIGSLGVVGGAEASESVSESAMVVSSSSMSSPCHHRRHSRLLATVVILAVATSHRHWP